MKTLFVPILAALGTTVLVQATQVDISGPAGSGAFGTQVTVLPNGNFVVTDPTFDLTAPVAVADVGAVYLYSANGTLLNTLTGSQADDQVGLGSIIVLSDGNYVVASRLWDNGGVIDAGAVTWCSAAGGPDRVVTDSNSLVGTTDLDKVGAAVTALAAGRYLARSPEWDNGGLTDAGAATWCEAGGGTVGAVSAANSLFGASASDLVPTSVTLLTTGKVVVISRSWDNGASAEAGAVTFVTDPAGITGSVSSLNSIVGTNAGDDVGSSAPVELSNGNVVVYTKFWNGNRGAVTWINGTTGLVGEVSDTNSFVGQVAGDSVGDFVRALTNGNYVVHAHTCDIDGVVDAGAVTFCNGTTGLVGNPSAANSLVGSTASDRVGDGFVWALSNGNYVVASPKWDHDITLIADVGAATWCNGTTGRVGAVTSTNSLVGTTLSDGVGSAFVRTLSNGNYVVASPNWDNGGITNAGAATWGNGTTGITGAVSASNSLIGSTASDSVGSTLPIRLNNGNYVVATPNWDSGAISDAGAATWCNGSTGRSGTISSANSLIGSSVSDSFGRYTIPLANGNYVAASHLWNNGATADVGAAVLGNGNTGTFGVVSAANALIGSTANDRVGGAVFSLTNGGFVVSSSEWNNGALVDAGAATWSNGVTAPTGFISPANSFVGGAAFDGIGGPGINALPDGNFYFPSPNWDDGANVNAGAVTFGNGTGGGAGLLSPINTITPAPNAVFTAYRATLPKALFVGNPSLNVVSYILEAPNQISLSNSTFTVTETGGPLQLTITRSGPTTAAQSVTLNTTAGTATANADYRSITGQVVNFPVGVGSVTVPITILSGNALNEPSETFTLTLSTPTSGAVLGATSTATVTIVETNSTPAGAPSITTPAASAVLSIASGTTAIIGSATDVDGVASVEVSLNGGPFIAATLTPASGTTVAYALNITPVAGRNDIFVRAIDALANVSPIASRSFIVMRQLSVVISGPGTVSAGFTPSSFRMIGGNVSITAKANTGALFNNWTIAGPPASIASITPAMLDQATLSFTMREGITLTANFATNPYTTANTGTFNGLVTADATLPDRAPPGPGPEDGTAIGVSTEGGFSITALPNATFTGKLNMDGLALNIVGIFDANGIAHFGPARSRTHTVPRAGKPSLRVSMTLSGTQITGTVAALDFTQTIIAVSNFTSHRAVFNASSPVSATFLGTASAPQLYTCLLPYIEQSAQIAGHTKQTYPQGDGIGGITLTKLGAITAALVLPDGTAFTTSTTADAGMNWRLFAPLYASKGYLQGSAQFNLADPDTDLLATTEWRWTKPQDLKQQHYPSGWTHLKLNMHGAKYVIPAPTSVVKAIGGFDLSATDPLGNATLTFANGQLTSPIEKTLNISATNLIAKLPATDASFTATIAKATGRITGSFTHEDGTKPTFQSVILQKGLNASARGFFLTTNPAVIDFTGETGRVELLGR